MAKALKSSAIPRPSGIALAVPITFGACLAMPGDAIASGSQPEALAHADEIVRYTMTATLDPAAHTVHGEGTLRWRNASDVPVREIWMHLYLNAFKNEKSVFLRTPLAGGRGGGQVKDWGYVDVRKLLLRETSDGHPADLWPNAEMSRPGDPDETDARVPLPRAVNPGETITLDMSWDDKLPSVVERTGYDGTYHFVAQWFPKIARLEPDGRWAHFPFHRLSEFYADYGTYDVTLDVPHDFTIGATGVRAESRIDRGRRIERFVQNDIHDFAWTAWNRWQTAADVIDGVQVMLLYPPSYRVDSKRELETLRFALPYYNAVYGRYPYPTLTVVHPPDTARESGGMEYPTLITTGGPWYGPPGVLGIELVTVHEFGHQYFYGLIASNENAWPMLDEGMNSFAELEAMARWRGAGSVVDLGGFTFSDAAMQAVASNTAVHDEKVAQPASAFVSGADYGRLVYFRTGAVMETLRRVYGDEPVMRAVGNYARAQRFRHPTPEDLFASLGETLEPRAVAMVRTALFDKGWVDYVVTGVHSQRAHDAAGIFDRDGKRETVPEAQNRGGSCEGWVLVTRRGTLALPVDIELTLEDGTTQRVHWDGDGESFRVPYSGASPLRAAVVDPDARILIDQNRTNNFATAPSGERAGAPRTFERLMYWAELLVQAVLP